jgi:hypothetical protein
VSKKALTNAQKATLQRYALDVLYALEQSDEWGADTVADISGLALSWGLCDEAAETFRVKSSYRDKQS